MRRRTTTATLTGGALGVKAVSIGDVDEFLDWMSSEKGVHKLPQELYAAVAWSYWCAKLRANNVASVPHGIYTAGSDEDTDENKVEFGIDLPLILKWVEMWLTLVGGAYVLKLKNSTGLMGLQVLNANSMRVETSGSKLTDPLRFIQRVGGKEKIYDADEIVYFRTFNPHDDIGPGISSGQVSSMSGSLILNANEWASRFFKNGAIPAVILEAEGQVPDEEIDRLRTSWNRMLQRLRQWSTVVLRRGMTTRIIGQPVKDLAMPELSKDQKEQIVAAHDLPIGISEPKTNRAERQQIAFDLWDQHLTPYCKTEIVPVLNEQLFNPLGMRIAFLYNKIEAIQREELAKAEATAFMIRDVMLPALAAKAVTVPETRRVLDSLLESVNLPKLDENPMLDKPTPEDVIEGEIAERLLELPASTESVEPGGLEKKALDGASMPQECRAELQRWAEKCRKRDKAAHFNSDIIPEWFKAEIDAAIETVGHVEAFSFLKATDRNRRRAERVLQSAIQPVLDKFHRAITTAITKGETPDYAALAAALRAKILPTILAAFTDQALRVSDLVGVGFDPSFINADAIAWARNYTYDLVAGLTNTTRKLVRESLTTYLEVPGLTRGDLSQLLEGAFGEVRAEMIAITEITRAYSQATNEIQARVNETGLQMTRVWNTRNDEIVCFPAGTMIATDSGTLPIEYVREGQRVLTRNGYERVKTTSKREYAGKMAVIAHDLGALVCTNDHPVWVLQKGWLKAGQINIGDRLQTTDDQASFVNGVIEFFVKDTDDRPSFFVEKARFPEISTKIGMPVFAVNFKGSTQGRQQEIDAIPSDFGFLDVDNVKSVQDFANRFFKQCLTLKAAVTSKTAELPIGIARANANDLSAIPTRNSMSRPTALLRAIATRVAGFRNKKLLTAPFTFLIPNRVKAALHTANGITVNHASIDKERFTADGANLFDFEKPRSALFATEAAVLGDLRGVTIEHLITPGTREHLPVFGRCMVALRGAIDLLLSFWIKFFATLRADFHSIRSLTELERLYHRMYSTSSITVYNLQVEGDPVFFADGVLVHNCDICGPLNGKTERHWAAQFPDGPPAHPRCRCEDTLSAFGEEYHDQEAARLAAEREAYMREQGLWKGPKPEAI